MWFGAFFSRNRFRISNSELLARVAPWFPDNPGVETAKTVSKVQTTSTEWREKPKYQGEALRPKRRRKRDDGATM
jgi:hypothetical protein